MKNSRAAIEINKSISIVQMVLGIFFLFIFGLSTVACFYVPEISPDPAVARAFLVTCLIFDVLGVILIIFSIKRIKRIKKFNQKTNYIIGSGTNNQQGAARPVIPTNTAQPQTNTAQSQTNTAQPQTNTAQSQTNTAQSQSAPRAQKIQVICECCGGINKIEKGIVSECEYCGSPIKG